MTRIYWERVSLLLIREISVIRGSNSLCCVLFSRLPDVGEAGILTLRPVRPSKKPPSSADWGEP
jgi:hypothetical protein